MALAIEYDGIWFLGFNVQKPPFDNLYVRQAVTQTIDKQYLAANIISVESVPTSFIPPGMAGYDPSLYPYLQNIAAAKSLMKKTFYKNNPAALKKLTLLHTDGVKTIAIARQIRDDLKQLGMRIDLVQVSYRDEERWNRELNSRKHQLFLMGYKADMAQLLSTEATPKVADSYLLLSPLFRSGGDANFSGYTNSSVDYFLDQVSVIGPTFQTERDKKLKAINRVLNKDLPAIVLFYIEKM